MKIPYLALSTFGLMSLAQAATIPGSCSTPGSCGDLVPTFQELNVKTDLNLVDADGSNYMGIKSPAVVTADTVLTLPDGAGANGEILTTDGNGSLSWSAIASGLWTGSGGNIYFNTGNVGIGTNNPGSLFVVDYGIGEFGITTSTVSTQNRAIVSATGTEGRTSLDLLGTNNASNPDGAVAQIGARLMTTDTPINNGDADNQVVGWYQNFRKDVFGGGVAGSYVFYRDTDQSVTYPGFTSGSDWAMALQPDLDVVFNGKIGVGTTTPDNSIEIGDVDNHTDYGLAIENSRWGLVINNTSGVSTTHPTAAPMMIHDEDNGTILRVQNNGSIGVNTSAPDASLNLDVEGKIGAIEYCNEDGTTCEDADVLLGLASGAGGAVAWESDGTNSLIKSRNSAGTADSGVVVTDDGNVGIGTTTPGDKLEVSNGTNSIKVGGETIGFTRNTANYLHAETAGGYLAVVTNGNPKGFSTAALVAEADNDVLVPNGNLGVGTNSPARTLHVVGAGRYDLADADTIDINSVMTADATNNYGALDVGVVSTGATKTLHRSGIRVALESASDQDMDAGIRIVDNSTTNEMLYGIYASAGADNYFAGNVGVGTTAPTNKLQIGSIGSAGYTGNQIVGGNGTDAFAINAAGSKTRFYSTGDFDLINSGDFLVYGGQTGIGDLTPEAGLKLDVEGRVGATEYCDADGLNCTAAASIGGGGKFVDGATVANAVFTGGNVGVGTLVPSSLLQVSGAGDTNLHVHSTDNVSQLAISDTLGSAKLYSLNGVLGFMTGGDAATPGDNAVEHVRIASSGYTGFGTTSPGAKIVVSGDGSASINNSSIRLEDSSATGNGGVVGIQAVTNGVGYHDLELGPSLNTIFKTGGDSEKMRITSAGSVGIGTNAPSSNLHVYNGGLGTLKVEGGSTGAPARRAILELAGNNENRAEGVITSRGGVEQWFFGQGYNNDSFTIGFDSAQAEYAANSKLFITSAGNVGIGTTSPSTIFHVANSGSVGPRFETTSGSSTDYGVTIKGARNGTTKADTAYVDFANFDSNEGAGTEFVTARVSGGMDTTTGQTGVFQVSTNDGTGLQKRMIIDAAGNMGIGTSTPAAPLQIGGSLQFDRGGGAVGTGSDIWMSAQGLISAENNLFINSDSDGLSLGDIVFGSGADTNAATEHMRVTASGNVGIGDSAPNDGTAGGGQALKLDVEGAIGATHYCDENGENCSASTELKTISTPSVALANAARGICYSAFPAGPVNRSMIMVPLTSNTADLDGLCHSTINSGWHSAGVAKSNAYNQNCISMQNSSYGGGYTSFAEESYFETNSANFPSCDSTNTVVCCSPSFTN